MPRVGEDEGGGGSNAEKTGSGFGGWLGGAARAMTGGTGAGYVVLGGARYGLRLSQVNIYLQLYEYFKNTFIYISSLNIRSIFEN